jgi:hypothetical protein
MRDLIKKILSEYNVKHKSSCNDETIITEMKKLTTQDFIERAKKIQGEKFDYSKSIYIGMFEPITIICPIHGKYTQRADAHLRGQDCPICGDEKAAKSNRLTPDEFIEKAKKVHGEKYDYSQTVYFSRGQNRGIIKIICPTHGEFFQSAENHLKGSGCNKCAGRFLQDKNEFIKKSKEIFGDAYDYSQVDYKGAVTKVGLICKKHGLFTVTPTNHISKQSGCPICKESKGERLVSQILDSLKIEYIRQKTFDDCRGNTGKKFCRKLPFDFYLPNFNTIIEYDGRQHFQPVMEFGGQEGFEKIQITDKLKNDYLERNNIKVIRIPYTTKNEDVLQLIQNSLDIG